MSKNRWRSVELLGGDITIHSELGKGSVFTFRIPYEPVIHQETKSAAKFATSAISIPPDTRVLIVEDDINNFLLAKNLLTSYNPVKKPLLYRE